MTDRVYTLGMDAEKRRVYRGKSWLTTQCIDLDRDRVDGSLDSMVPEPEENIEFRKIIEKRKEPQKVSVDKPL